MEQISFNLDRYLTPQTTAKSERADWGELLKEATDLVNKEREKMGWKYFDKKTEKWKRLGKMTIPQMAGKVGFMSGAPWDLESHINSCKRSRSFSHDFFRKIKVDKDKRYDKPRNRNDIYNN